jgi:hypothetical protein
MATDGRFDPSIAGCAIAEATGEVNLACTFLTGLGRSLAQGAARTTYQQAAARLCAGAPILVFPKPCTRTASTARWGVSRPQWPALTPRARQRKGGQPAGGSARVVELVNAHEKLREQVAESLRELDNLIGQLEA